MQVDPASVLNETVLEEAARVVSGPRQRDYAHPAINFNRIAILWSVIFETEITERQVMQAMVALKIARDISTPTRDNLVDIAGYVRCGEMIEEYADHREMKSE